MRRRGHGRDPFRVRLKSTAPHSRNPQQLLLDLAAKPTAPPQPQWPEHQTDLEEYLANLREKRT